MHKLIIILTFICFISTIILILMGVDENNIFVHISSGGTIIGGILCLFHFLNELDKKFDNYY